MTIEIPKGASKLRARNRALTQGFNRSFAIHAQGTDVEIDIYDEIGFFGITASDVRRALKGTEGAATIRVRINSPGGDVFDGIAIHNDLRDHPAKVEVTVSGIAASAASIIAMAGDRIEMAENAFMMIHNAWAIALGDKEDMRAVADVLEQIDGVIAQSYARRTGLAISKVAAMMDDETWMTAAQAIEDGFADSTTENAAEAQALFDLSVFNKVPVPLKRKIEAGLRDVGFSNAEAKAAIAEGFHHLSDRDGRVERRAERDVGGALTDSASARRLAEKFRAAAAEYEGLRTA